MPERVMLVFGTRPEAIKLCPLVKALQEGAREFQPVVCVTGQHRGMLDQVLSTFGITPEYDLDVMRPNQTLSELTAHVLLNLGPVLEKERPDLLLVQGDTITTVVASLAAYYRKIKVGHIEAGLRTGNKYSPFPEEINRRLTSVIADVHFAPTEVSRRNLLQEGIAERDIVVTGNTVIDAILWVQKKIAAEYVRYKGLESIRFDKRIILVTGHRRENFGRDFWQICTALKEIALSHPEVEIVYPVHLNPNVREPVNSVLSSIPNVRLIEPLEYEPFISLMARSYFIITDSGGIQEEAPSLGKPVLVTRNTTERTEAVSCGAVKLVGTDRETIVREADHLLENAEAYSQMSKVHNPYGDGLACQRIIDAMRRLFIA